MIWKEVDVQRFSVKKVFLEILQNSQENTCARVAFLIKLQQACNFIKKETSAQVFSCEFCEISKNTFFHRTPPVVVSLWKADDSGGIMRTFIESQWKRAWIGIIFYDEICRAFTCQSLVVNQISQSLHSLVLVSWNIMYVVSPFSSRQKHLI